MCDCDGLKFAVLYKDAQADLFSAIALQLQNICQAGCGSTTSRTLIQSYRILRSILFPTCSPQLLINNNTAYCGILFNSAGLTPSATTNPVNTSYITASGTVTIGTDNIAFNSTTDSASGVATVIQNALNAYRCGLYSCMGLLGVNNMQLTLSVPNTITLTIFNSFSQTYFPTTIFTGISLSDLANNINISYGQYLYAFASGSNLVIDVFNGYNIQYSGVNQVTFLYSDNSSSGTTTPLNPALTYTNIGYVQICSNNLFSLSNLSIDISSTTTVTPTTTSNLITSYCPQYTVVKSATCGSISIELDAPNFPVNALLTALNNFLSSTTNTPYDQYLLNLSICNLANLASFYACSAQTDKKNYCALIQTTQTMARYCSIGCDTECSPPPSPPRKYSPAKYSPSGCSSRKCSPQLSSFQSFKGQPQRGKCSKNKY